MNAEIKAQWLQALRSGKYKQARGKLRQSSGFCCLGVLCDLAVQAKAIGPPRLMEYGYWAYEEITGRLPKQVQDWAEIIGPDPIISLRQGDKSFHHRLTSLNDSSSYDFNQLADIIETQERL